MNGKMCFQVPEVFPKIDPAKGFLDIYMEEVNSRGMGWIIFFMVR